MPLEYVVHTGTTTPGGWLLEGVDADVLATELSDEQLDMLRSWFGRLPTVALAYDQQPAPEPLATHAPNERVVDRQEYVTLELLLGRDPTRLLPYAVVRYAEVAGAMSSPGQYLFADEQQAAAVLDQYPAPEL